MDAKSCKVNQPSEFGGQHVLAPKVDGNVPQLSRGSREPAAFSESSKGDAAPPPIFELPSARALAHSLPLSLSQPILGGVDMATMVGTRKSGSPPTLALFAHAQKIATTHRLRSGRPEASGRLGG